jgi:hypothetical protein
MACIALQHGCARAAPHATRAAINLKYIRYTKITPPSLHGDPVNQFFSLRLYELAKAIKLQKQSA